MLVLITGGARSGKSGFAERYAACLGGRGVYVATGRAWDAEMEERVRLHKAARKAGTFSWETVEEPLDLAGGLERLAGSLSHGGPHSAAPSQGDNPVVLVDCLTLWLTNLLLDAAPEEQEWSRPARESVSARAEAELERLLDVLGRMPVPVLLVTNEVGDGIVPEYPLGRLFRDLSGRMNQRIAARCGQVFLVTAGIPVELKSLAFRLPETGMCSDK